MALAGEQLRDRADGERRRRVVVVCGLLAACAYVVHGGHHVLRGAPWDLLWACNVAPLLLAAGGLLGSPRLCGVALLWLTFGTPMWLVDVATGAGIIPTTYLTHVGCPVLAALAVRELGMPRNSWALASAGILTLMLVCRLVSPAEHNINLSHAVWAGWESSFPRYDVYFAVVFGGATATFFVADKIWGRVLRRR